MPLSLKEQLASAYAADRGSNADVIKRLDKRYQASPSILFDLRSAADIDDNQVFQLAASGFAELSKKHSGFCSFHADFFADSLRHGDRSDLTIEENQVLSEKIKNFLRLLSCHLMEDAGLRCMEWMIRRFRVHVLDRDSFIEAFLVYHDVAIFPKALTLVDLNDESGRWRWLAETQRFKSAIPRSVFVKRCRTDLGFSLVLLDLLSFYLRFVDSSQCCNWVSFVVATILGFLRQYSGKSAPEREFYSQLYVFLASSLSLSSSRSAAVAYLVMLTELFCRSKEALGLSAIETLCKVIVDAATAFRCEDAALVSLIALVERHGTVVSEFPPPVLKLFGAIGTQPIHLLLSEKHVPLFEERYVRHMAKSGAPETVSHYLAVVSPKQQFLRRIVCADHPLFSKYLESVPCESDVADVVSIVDESSLMAAISIDLSSASSAAELPSAKSNLSLLPTSPERLRLLVRSFFLCDQPQKSIAILILVNWCLVSLSEDESVEQLIPLLIFACTLQSEQARAFAFASMQTIVARSLIKPSAEAMCIFGPQVRFPKLASVVKSLCSNHQGLVTDSSQLKTFFQGASSSFSFWLLKSALVMKQPQVSLALVQLVGEISPQALIRLASSDAKERSLDESIGALLLHTTCPAEPEVDPLLTAVENSLSQDRSLQPQIASAIVDLLLKWSLNFVDSKAALFRFHLHLMRLASFDSSFRSIIAKRFSISELFVKTLFSEFLSQQSSPETAEAKRHSAASSGHLSLCDEVSSFLELFSLQFPVDGSGLPDCAVSLALISGLFEAISVVVNCENSQNFDFFLQLLLSTLSYILSQWLAISSQKSRAVLIDEDAIRTDVLIQCLRSSTNPTIHRLCISCVAAVATILPTKVLDSILPLFTFMGATCLRLDNASSFAVIENAMNSILPVLVKDSKLDEREVLAVFLSSLPHIPRHRNQRLFRTLVQCLASDPFPISYWLFSLLADFIQSESKIADSDFFIDDLLRIIAGLSVEILFEFLQHSVFALLHTGDSFSAQRSDLERTARHLGFSLAALQSKSKLEASRLKISQFLFSVASDREARSKSSSAADKSSLFKCVESLIQAIELFPRDRSLLELLHLLTSEYLPFNSFVDMVRLLLRQQNLILTRKGLQLLNEKIRNSKNSLTEDQTLHLLDTMLPGLLECIESSTGDDPSVQAALMSGQILCQVFSQVLPDAFLKLFRSAMAVSQKLGCQAQVTGTFLATLATYCNSFPKKLLPEMRCYVSMLLKSLRSDCAEWSEVFLQSSLSSLSVVISKQASFLSPYLNSIVLVLLHLENFSKSVREVALLLCNSVEARLLFPLLLAVVDQDANTLLLEMIGACAARASTETVAANVSLFVSFVCANWAMNGLQHAVGRVLLRMNSATFQQFLASVLEFVSLDSAKLQFFGLFLENSFSSLQSLFSPYFDSKIFPTTILPWFSGKGELIGKVESLNHSIACSFLEAIAESLRLRSDAPELAFVRSVCDLQVQILGNCADSSLLSASFIKCTVSLTKAVLYGSNDLELEWKEHFLEPILSNADSSGSVWRRSFTIEIITSMFGVDCGEQMLALLPDLLPSISEWLQDSDEIVEEKARLLSQRIEHHLGEPLLKHLE